MVKAYARIFAGVAVWTALLWVSACTHEVEQTGVVVEVYNSGSARAFSSIRIKVVTQDGEQAFSRELPAEFPQSLFVVPRGGDSTRTFEAIAYGLAGSTVTATVRKKSGFEPHRVLRIRLDLGVTDSADPSSNGGADSGTLQGDGGTTGDGDAPGDGDGDSPGDGDDARDGGLPGDGDNEDAGSNGSSDEDPCAAKACTFTQRRRAVLTSKYFIAVEDLQVPIEVPWIAGSQEDFGDLRVTDADGITPLPYWIESTVKGERARLWVRVPSLPKDRDVEVYLYSGNSESNRTGAGKPFLFFDDFDALDTSLWNGPEKDITFDHGVAHLATGSLVTTSPIEFQNVVIAEARLRWLASNTDQTGMMLTDVPHTCCANAAGDRLLYMVSHWGETGLVAGYYANGTGPDFNIFAEKLFQMVPGQWEVLGIDVSSAGAALHRNGSVIHESAEPWTVPFYLGLGKFDGSTDQAAPFELDWVRLRRHINPLPDVAVEGVETVSQPLSL
jgi:hypothetical protein